MNRDLRGVLLSAAYLLALLVVAEVARRRGVARSATRKIVHVGVGTWIVPSFLLYSTWVWPALLAAGFVLVNALSLRYGWIASMEGERRNVGTILYPLSFALLVMGCWGTRWQAVGAGGVLVMAYGDAAASLVGRRWGRHVYRVAGHPRSVEGSAAMFLVSWAAVLAGFWAFGRVPDSQLVLTAAVVAAVATGLEAVSLFGFDNLLVPLGAAGVLALSRGSLWS